MPLSMRVPNVSPASDGYSCRELSLYEWWEKCRRVRKEGAILFRAVTTQSMFSAVFSDFNKRMKNKEEPSERQP